MSENYTGKVSAVVIPRTSDREEFLIAKRSDNGDWEFPGGKQHPNESIIKTAEREIMEELGLDINADRAAEKNSYSGGGYKIIPVLAEIEENEFEINLVDHSDFRWIRPERVKDLEIDLDNERKCLEAFDFL
ncbi:MAG: NUDIX domain-containing protein [Candidatus Nanohaloarchaea archaeon]